MRWSSVVYLMHAYLVLMNGLYEVYADDLNALSV